MKLFLKMYKLREVQISHNRPDNPSAASQPRGQTPHGRAREVRCVTRRRPAAVSGTARAYTLRPAARPLEARGPQTPLSRRRAIVYGRRTSKRVASSRLRAGNRYLSVKQCLARSKLMLLAGIASSLSFAHGR